VNQKKEGGKKKMEVNAVVTGMEKKRADLGMTVADFYAVPRDPPSESKLPIFDAAHVRNALARFNQTQGLTPAEKKSAMSKITAKAKHFGIDTANVSGNSLVKVIKDLNLEGYSASPIMANADQSLMDSIDEVREAINDLDTQDSIHFLEDVFDSYVIYCTRLRDMQTGSFCDEQLYKQTYQTDPNTGDVTLTGDPIPVEKQTTYVNANKKVVRTKFNNNSKGGNEMSTGKEGCGQCMEKIVAIINSNAAGMTAEDRTWLLTQEEATLDILLAKKPVGINAATPPAGGEKMMKVSDCKPTQANAATVTPEQIMNAMSAEDRAALAYGKKQLQARKATMIQGIQDNTSKEIWPDAVLNTLSEDLLEKVYASVYTEPVGEVNYSLNGNSRHIDVNAGGEEGLYPMDVVFDNKK
jgi:hypothetical protein